MQHNGFGRLASAALLVVALAGCTSSADDPAPAPSTVAVPEDVELEAVCGTVDPALVERLLPAAEADATADGPGDLSCSSGTDGQVDLVAVEGSVVVRLTFVRTGEGEVSSDERADLDTLVSGLLTAMPER